MDTSTWQAVLDVMVNDSDVTVISAERTRRAHAVFSVSSYGRVLPAGTRTDWTDEVVSLTLDVNETRPVDH